MVGLATAEPTPKKPKRGQKSSRTKAAPKKVHRMLMDDDDEEQEEDRKDVAMHREQEQLPPVVLPAKRTFTDIEAQPTFAIWDDSQEKAVRQRVVNQRSSMPPLRPLPIAGDRPPGKDQVGSAGHMFMVPEVVREMSGWIAGYLDLPPQAIKDAELVGRYAQVFFVGEGQPGSLEFGLSDPAFEDWDDRKAQRVILSPGDSFYVPPGNIYRLENHSLAKTCKIFFVVIEPIADPYGDAGSSVSAATVAASSR